MSGMSLPGGELGKARGLVFTEPVLCPPCGGSPPLPSFRRAQWAAGNLVARFVPVSSGHGPRLPVRGRSHTLQVPGLHPRASGVFAAMGGGHASSHLIFISPFLTATPNPSRYYALPQMRKQAWRWEAADPTCAARAICT